MSDLQMWEESASPINTLHVWMHAHAYAHPHTHPRPNPQTHTHMAWEAVLLCLARGAAAGIECQPIQSVCVSVITAGQKYMHAG